MFPDLPVRATLCRPSGPGASWRIALVVALRAGCAFGAGGCGKAAAEPPHSIGSWAWMQFMALRKFLVWAARASHWVLGFAWGRKSCAAIEWND
jgi:hypothetical protein